MDVIRIYADPRCSSHLVNSIRAIDYILDARVFTHHLKALFGLEGLQHDVDFVAVLEVRSSARTPCISVRLTMRCEGSIRILADQELGSSGWQHGL